MFFIIKGIMLKSNTEVVSAAGLTMENLSNLNWSGLFVNNLIPVTLGNVIGGGFFAAILYWVVYLKPQKEDA